MTDTPATTTLATPDDSSRSGVLESTDLTLPVPSEVWSHPVDAWTQAQEALNPLRSSGVDRVIAPAAMVIFGVSGDLTSRKLMPALYDLAVGQPLPEGFSVVGVSHRDWSDEEFREKMREAVTATARTPVTEDAWQGFAKGLSYVRVTLTIRTRTAVWASGWARSTPSAVRRATASSTLQPRQISSCPLFTGWSRPRSPNARRITSSQARVGSASSSKNRSVTTSSRLAT